MDNTSSRSNATDLHLGEPVVDATLIVVFLIIAVWYVVSLCIHLKETSGSLSIKVLCVCKFGKESLPKMLLFSGVFCVLFLLASTLFILIPFLPLHDYDLACNVIADVNYFVYGSAHCTIYLYLWLRMKFLLREVCGNKLKIQMLYHAHMGMFWISGSGIHLLVFCKHIPYQLHIRLGIQNLHIYII